MYKKLAITITALAMVFSLGVAQATTTKTASKATTTTANASKTTKVTNKAYGNGTYSGEWKNGKPEGKGTWRKNVDQFVHTGTFKNGNLVDGTKVVTQQVESNWDDDSGTVRKHIEITQGTFSGKEEALVGNGKQITIDELRNPKLKKELLEQTILKRNINRITYNTNDFRTILSRSYMNETKKMKKTTYAFDAKRGVVTDEKRNSVFTITEDTDVYTLTSANQKQVLTIDKQKDEGNQEPYTIKLVQNDGTLILHGTTEDDDFFKRKSLSTQLKEGSLIRDIFKDGINVFNTYGNVSDIDLIDKLGNKIDEFTNQGSFGMNGETEYKCLSKNKLNQYADITIKENNKFEVSYEKEISDEDAEKNKQKKQDEQDEMTVRPLLYAVMDKFNEIPFFPSVLVIDGSEITNEEDDANNKDNEILTFTPIVNEQLTGKTSIVTKGGDYIFDIVNVNEDKTVVVTYRKDIMSLINQEALNQWLDTNFKEKYGSKSIEVLKKMLSNPQS